MNQTNYCENYGIVGIKDDDLPNFSKNIFKSKKISDKEKRKFIKDFLKGYLEDYKNIRKYDKWYIFFVDNIYEGCYKTTDETDGIFPENADIECFRIGISDIYACNHRMRPVKWNAQKHTCGEFLVDCELNIKNDEGIFKKVGDATGMVDSGATITTFFPSKIWDFPNQKFNESVPGLIFGEELREELEYLRKNKKLLSNEDVETQNGPCVKKLMEFKKPIYVGIENLTPVPIYYLLIDITKPDPLMPILIGLDVLHQHKLELETINGIPIMSLTDKNPSVDATSTFKRITNLFIKSEDINT